MFKQITNMALFVALALPSLSGVAFSEEGSLVAHEEVVPSNDGGASGDQVTSGDQGGMAHLAMNDDTVASASPANQEGAVANGGGRRKMTSQEKQDALRKIEQLEADLNKTKAQLKSARSKSEKEALVKKISGYVTVASALYTGYRIFKEPQPKYVTRFNHPRGMFDGPEEPMSRPLQNAFNSMLATGVIWAGSKLIHDKTEAEVGQLQTKVDDVLAEISRLKGRIQSEQTGS